MGILLKWVNRTPGGTSQRIYRSLEPFTGLNLPVPLAEIDAAASRYDDTLATPDVAYYYRVGLVRGGQELLSGMVRAIGGATTPAAGTVQVFSYVFDPVLDPQPFYEIDLTALPGTVWAMDVTAYGVDFQVSPGNLNMAAVVGGVVKDGATDYGHAKWNEATSSVGDVYGFLLTSGQASGNPVHGMTSTFGLGQDCHSLCDGWGFENGNKSQKFARQTFRKIAEEETAVRITCSPGAIEIDAGYILANLWVQ